MITAAFIAMWLLGMCPSFAFTSTNNALHKPFDYLCCIFWPITWIFAIVMGIYTTVRR